MSWCWSEGAIKVRAVESDAARFSRLPPGRRRKLATLTDCPHTDGASLCAHLAYPSSGQKVAASLKAAGAVAAAMLVEAHEALSEAILMLEAEARGLEDLVQEGLEELEEAGLLLRLSWSGGAELILLPPPLSSSLGPFLWMLEASANEAGAWTHTDLEAAPMRELRPARRASVDLIALREMSLALAAVAADPPRLPREGGVHLSDITRLCEEHYPPGSNPTALRGLVVRLLELDFLRGRGGRAQVDWGRVELFFSRSPGAQLPLLLATDREVSAPSAGRQEGRTLRCLLAAALAALPEGNFVSPERLEGAVRLRLMAIDATTPHAEGRERLSQIGRQVHFELENMLDCFDGLYSQGAKGPLKLRLPLAELRDREEACAEHGEWIVQPSHEIMVPPEVSEAALISLASIASLQKVDTMLRFQLQPVSVARAGRDGFDAEEIFERLQAHAAHSLPEDLLLQVEDWLDRGESDGEAAEREASELRELPAHLHQTSMLLPEKLATGFSPEVEVERARLRLHLSQSALLF